MPDTELVTSLKRNATKIIAKVKKNREPLLITHHGRPAAYLLDADTFEGMQDRMVILEGLARGEIAIREGRVTSHEQARKKMRRWLK